MAVSRNRVIASGCLGMLLEWYDYALYAYFAPIISQCFFPTTSKLSSLLLTFSTFALGFLARPLGGLVFGHIGDTRGRKVALMWSLALMTLTTCGIGLLPTYETIGILAPFSLMLLRIGQGMAMGGELMGSLSLYLESRENKPFGFGAAFIFSFAGYGYLLGSLVASTLASMMTPADIQRFGWRLAFMTGMFTAMLLIFVRRDITESTPFLKLQERQKTYRFPFWEGVRQLKGQVLSSFLIFSLSGVSSVTLFVFFPSYLHQFVGYPLEEALKINTAGNFFSTILIPFTGWLSDRVGRKPLLIFAAAFFAIGSVPAFAWISGGDRSHMLIAYFVACAVSAFCYGPMVALMLETFPLPTRYSVASVIYNLGYGVCGGLSPVIAMTLMDYSSIALAPAIWLSLVGVLALIAIIQIQRPTLASSAT